MQLKRRTRFVIVEYAIKPSGWLKRRKHTIYKHQRRKCTGRLLLLLVLFTKAAAAQTEQENTTIGQQLENRAAEADSENEDDSYLQQLHYFRRHPLSLNTCTATDLQAFTFLNALQVSQFFRYRNLLGKFISVYELQAIPAWDAATVRLMLPFVQTGAVEPLSRRFRTQLLGGEHKLLLRVQQVLEKSTGFHTKDSLPAPYAGGRQRVFFRYTHNYKNKLQYGLLGDKDAGEQFFKGAQKAGFDFYSLHFFIRDAGIIRQLALGDFTVNMGQGLICWQALSFRKSADGVNIKRQADILRPYTSPTEFNFNRGVGVTVGKKHWSVTAFGSYRKLSGSMVTDTLPFEDRISGIGESGLHRTLAEIANRNNTVQMSAGGNAGYTSGKIHAGVNVIHHRFDKALQKADKPYNYFSFNGKRLTNASIDYSYTLRNLHFFGEFAVDHHLQRASLHGMIASLDPRFDLSVLYRDIGSRYQNLYGSAFTEGTAAANERGLYIGATMRPFAGITINGYADLYRFPWLRFGVDAPAGGNDYLLEINWRPNKQVEMYSRFRAEKKAHNLDGDAQLHVTGEVSRRNWRTQFSYKASAAITIRARAELVWYGEPGKTVENGFLLYGDLFYKPMMRPFSGNIRLACFETGGYNSRMYAYENDVLYGFSLPPVYGKGFRWYLNLNYDISKSTGFWLRIAQTVLPDAKTMGSGNDAVPGNRKTELKMQVLHQF